MPDADDAAAQAEAKPNPQPAVVPNAAKAADGATVVDAAIPSAPPPQSVPPTPNAEFPPTDPMPAQTATANGTVVLNVDSGIVVPSFMGKSLRAAIEVAQQNGLELNILGSGVARQQSPPPGSHLLAGQKVTIRFSH
jgi:cell division protein FtsI (penicillin-binding protein 3)